MHVQSPIESIPELCEVEWVSRAAHDPPGARRLLIELPHGATRRRHFDRLRGRLDSALPDQLCEFFFVNTDVGCYETAQRVARRVAERYSRDPGCDVVIVRCLLPRTFVDCNRLLASTTGPHTAQMTAAIPEYVDNRNDRLLLERLHDEYQRLVKRAYETVCGGGGLALQLHTYAPRSIRIDLIDGSIVDTLRRAYASENYGKWEPRPEVEIISQDLEGRMLAPERLVAAVKRHFRKIGVDVAENATYRLHSDTTGYLHAAQYPGRVCCVELNREALADPFSPFEEMRIGADNAERMAAPLGAAYNESFE
jgi:hypothetical protein